LDFIHPENLRFECNRCGLCCGDTKEKTRHIIILESEAQEIQEKTGMKPNEFCHEVPDKQPYMFEMKKQPDGKCLFFKPEGCTIYEFRPLICRFYPFELKFDENKQAYIFTPTMECPAINLGKLLCEEDFRKLFLLAQERLP
jgi:Fe-S-cluster containining protein